MRAELNDPTPARRQFTLFSALFSAAILFHQVQLGNWEVWSLQLLVSLAAILCLVRPSDPRRFLALLAAHFVSLVVDSPDVVNHWLLVGALDLTVFVAVGIGLVRHGRVALDPGRLYLGLAPTLRLMVALVYAFAAFAKLNDSFLDPALSCGSYFAQRLLAVGSVGVWHDSLSGPAIWGTILVELALPVLLIVRATRVIGVLVGGVFHYTLFLTGHMPFTGFALAFYALFVPDDTPERFDRLRVRSAPVDRAARSLTGLAARPATLPLAAAAWTVVCLAITYGPRGDAVDSIVLYTTMLVFAVYYVALGVVLVLCLRDGHPLRWRGGLLRVPGPAWLLGPALVVMIGVSPYVGLKSQSVFTMYSNLQTEDGHWNHSLIPEGVRLFGLQDDVVRIVSSSDPVLARAAENDRRWLLFALRSRVADQPEINVTYEIDGNVVVANPAGQNAVLGDGPAWVLRKLVLMRDVPRAEDNVCRADKGEGPAQGS